MIVNKRREILFLYDVKDANPNGDPSDENKPRIDEETGINIVTDVRLKRTIRDYLFNYKGYNGEGDKDIFIRQTKSETKKGINDGKGRAKMFNNNKDIIINKCVDMRLFGAVIPLENESKKEKDSKKGDKSITFTGPVQFKMGRSLHRVEMKHIRGTGAFASKLDAQQETFREEYVLPYSLIAFYGIINENAAQQTKMTEDDYALLLESIWDGTRNLITRSKMEHNPRLLLTIEHDKPEYFIGELDRHIKLIKKDDIRDEQIRDIEEIAIDMSTLKAKLSDNSKAVIYKKDDRLNLLNWD